MRRNTMSRWWAVERDSPYQPGWLAKSGAPFRTVEDLDDVVHFRLGNPVSPKNGYPGVPGYTACDITFCWNHDFRGEADDPTPMTETRARSLTCVLCIGAF